MFLILQMGIEMRRAGKPVSNAFLTGYVYLLVNCSASMEGDELKQATNGALNFAEDALDKGYFTGLIRFDSSPKLIYEFFKDISNLEKRLVGLEIGDTTHPAKAINLAHELLREMERAPLIVIATNGLPNGAGNPIVSLNAGQSARRSGIDIIAIGAEDADRAFLNGSPHVVN